MALIDQFLDPPTTKPRVVSRPDPLVPPIHTVVDTISDYLTRPLSAQAGAVNDLVKGRSLSDAGHTAMEGLRGNQKTSYEDVLDSLGMQKGTARTLLGFGGDLTLDATNLLAGPIVKGLGKGAEALKLGELARKVPFIEEAVAHVKPYAWLPKEYAKDRSLLGSELNAGRSIAVHDTLNAAKGTTAAERQAALIDLEKGEGPEKFRKLLDAQAEEEMAAGVLPSKLKPTAERPNYVPYLFNGEAGQATRKSLARNLSAKNPFAQPKEFTSIEQALAAGAESDAAKVVATRLAAGKRSASTGRFFQQTAEKFGKPVEAAPLGYREVTLAADSPLKGATVGKVFHPDIANDLEKLVELGKNPGEIERLYDKTLGVWKGYATAVRPGFHVRNLVSNTFNMFLAGMNPDHLLSGYADAVRIIGDNSARRIGNYTAAEVNNAAKRLGIVGTGHGAFGDIGDILSKELDTGTKSQLKGAVDAINPLSRNNLAMKAGRKLGSGVEDGSRMALFLDQIKKGSSIEDAAMQVKKYLFDYHELTDTEKKYFRRVVPFYTWLRKNIPLQIQSLVENPARYASIGKTVNATEKATDQEGYRIPDARRPQFVQEQDYVQVPTKTSKGEEVFFNPNLPYQDLNRLDPRRIGREFFSSLSPLAKVPIERTANKEFFTDRPIYDPKVGPDQLVKAPDFMNSILAGSTSIRGLLGAKMIRQKGAPPTWMIPATKAYDLRQIPFLSSLGKAATPDESAGTIDTPLGPTTPATLDFWGGTKLNPSTPAARNKDLRYRRQDAMAKKRALNKQGRREVSSDVLDQILANR